MEINHKEAHLYASMHEDDSNLARCYLALEKRVAELEAAQHTLAPDGVYFCGKCGLMSRTKNCENCGHVYKRPAGKA